MSSATWIQLTALIRRNLRAQIMAAVKFHLTWLGLSPSTLITSTSQSFSLFHVQLLRLCSQTEISRWFFERNQGCKSECRVSPHLRCSIFTSPAGLIQAISPCFKVLSYILYDCPGNQAPDWFRNSACSGRGRQMQCCRYITGDRGRFDDQGPERDRFKQQHQQPVCVCRDCDG